MKRETTQIITMSIEMMKMACSHRKNVVGRLEIDTQQYTQQQQQNNNITQCSTKSDTTTIHKRQFTKTVRLGITEIYIGAKKSIELG